MNQIQLLQIRYQHRILTGKALLVLGLDAMVKAADVKLIHVEKRLGGRLVTIVVEGSVSAVQAAAEAGKAAAAEVGPVKLCEVIARPHEEVMKFLRTDPVP